jgi:glycosyltransferase involved in cell wall biosynthesis
MSLTAIGSNLPPRLLYVVTEDWAFLSHRLPMARAARDAGFEVHVATRIDKGATAIEDEGFILHPLPFSRGSLSLFKNLETVLALRRIRQEVKPDLTHHVALQACVLGMIAALGHRSSCVNAFIGMGYAFTTRTIKARTLRWLIGVQLRLLVNRAGSVALVQNRDDFETAISFGIPSKRIALIQGSGVDIRHFIPQPEPDGPITFGFVGRLLDDKGIQTLISAHRMLRTRGLEFRLSIAGTPDPANPASVTKDEANSWNDEPGVYWLGHVSDIVGFWSSVHVAVLPSRREGLPLSLLEAASCGRPMIASDVPGCREIVIHDQTGLLFPVDQVPALAEAMSKLAYKPQLRARYGAAARNMVVQRFSAAIVGDQIVQLYREILNTQNRTKC